MTQVTQEQRDVLQAAGWTEEEAAQFAQALVTFRNGLPPRQGEAFNAILATVGAAVGGEDVRGYIYQRANVPPTPGTIGQPPPTESNLVVLAVIAWIMPLLLPAVQ